jgi:D-galacturonate reductase
LTHCCCFCFCCCFHFAVALFRYTPDANGFFAGQTGYGYISIASFIEAAAGINSGSKSISYYEQEGQLALASKTLAVTAILQAGRLSLDNKGAAVDILYDDHGQPEQVRLAAAPTAAAT